MKQILLVLSCAMFFSLTHSSCTDKCSNGVQNSNENEIDCGGDCDPCPPEGTLTVTINGINYVAETVSGGDNGNGIFIFSNGTSESQHSISFSGLVVNQFSPVTDCDFVNSASNTYYNFQFGDAGSVYITSHNELRKIVSGRYWVSMTDGGNVTITDGIFENVRYN